MYTGLYVSTDARVFQEMFAMRRTPTGNPYKDASHLGVHPSSIQPSHIWDARNIITCVSPFRMSAAYRHTSRW